MVTTVGIAVLGAILIRAFAQEIVFVGSAGCDGDDPACLKQPEEDQNIHVFELAKSGVLTHKPELALPAGGTPSWLVTREASEPRCLFATRTDSNDVLAFAEAAGHFEHVASVPSKGKYPVHASITADGATLLVANYGDTDGASVSSYRIGDGCWLEHADTKQHVGGSAVDPGRQGSAHAHSIVAARGGFAYASDLGMDMIITYKVGPGGRLEQVHRTGTAPGAGPRHLVQHPQRGFAYVVNEMAQTVGAYRQERSGALTPLMTVDLSPGEHEGNKAAEIAILPDGSTLYVTNRGRRSTVTVFRVLDDGSLHPLQQIEVPSFPRGMSLARDSSVLFIAGQTSGEVASYRIGGPGGPDRGLLTRIAQTKGGQPPHAATFAMLQHRPTVEAGAAQAGCTAADCNSGRLRYTIARYFHESIKPLLGSRLVPVLAASAAALVSAALLLAVALRARQRTSGSSVRRISSSSTMNGGASAQNLLHLAVEAV